MAKGQILIPKPMRDAIGIKPGVDVVFELRDDEIVISKPKVEGNYTEYYASTSSPKLKKRQGTPQVPQLPHIFPTAK